MTTQIFKTRARVSPSIAERLLGRPPKANAIVDLRDSLANSADLREVTPQQVEAIALQYRTNLHRELRDERGSLYREYLEWSLKDGVLDDAEFEKLGHLRRVLFLDPDQVDLIHEDTLGSLYKSSVRKRAESADAASTSSFAAELAARLKLTEKLSERWRKDVLTSVISSRVDQMAADERISPEEDSELTMLAQSYGIKLTFEEQTREALDRYRYYWLAENGELPIIDAGVSLPHGEICHLRTGCRWLETRVVRRRINYAGPTMRLRIVKGIYWSAGSVQVASIPIEQLSEIDSGEVLLTNKRTIFLGARRNINVQHRKVLAINPVSVQGSPGVEIDKDAGKSPVLLVGCDLQAFILVLSRLIST